MPSSGSGLTGKSESGSVAWYTEGATHARNCQIQVYGQGLCISPFSFLGPRVQLESSKGPKMFDGFQMGKSIRDPLSAFEYRYTTWNNHRSHSMFDQPRATEKSAEILSVHMKVIFF